MKIAMFGHKYIPSRAGGVEVVVRELSTRMAALGHDVVCYNRKSHHVSSAEFNTRKDTIFEGVRLKTVPTLNKKGWAAVSSSFFAALYASFSDAGTVHIHAEGPAFLCWLPRLFGKHVVVTIHGLDWQREKWKNSLAVWYIRMGEKMAVRWAHEIIVLSKSAQDYFLSAYGRRTVRIPNGAARPLYRAPDLIRKEYGLEAEGYILFVGRLVPEKGIHYLIDAFRQLDIPKKLVIAGASSDTDDYCEKLRVMAAGDDRILFTGFVQDQMLQELYSNAWVYVLPSDVEGMPMSLLEAMSYGNCCVVSDIPECTQVAEGRLLAFPKGDAEALGRTLLALYRDQQKVTDMRAQAADSVCKAYSWDRIVQQTLELYR